MDEASSQKPAAGKTAADPAPDENRPAKEASGNKDLSQEIERSMDREPLDLVKCVRVFGNYYRCNWWSRADGARQEYAWTGVIVDCIRKSRFLTATMNAGELVVKEVGPVSTPVSRASRIK